MEVSAMATSQLAFLCTAFPFFFFFAGSGTFVLLAHLSRIWGGATHIRQKVQTGLVTAWGLR